MEQVIKRLYTYIKEDNIDGFDNDIKSLPIEKLSKNASFKLFRSLMIVSINANRIKFITIIITRWKYKFGNELFAEIIGYIDEILILRYIAKLENLNYEIYMSKLIEINYENVYNILLKYDEVFNKNYFKELPDKLNFEDFKFDLLSIEASNILFQYMFNNFENEEIVYEAWKETDMDDKTSFFTKLFFYNIDTDIISKIQKIEEKDYYEVMAELIFLSENDDVLSVAIKVHDFFGEQNIKTYENLKKDSEKINIIIYELMDDYIRNSKSNIETSIPEYLKDFDLVVPKEPPVNEKVDEKINIDISKLANSILEFSKEYFFVNDIQNIKDIEEKLRNMSSEELNSLIANMENEHTIKLFRIYGPSNAFNDENIPNQDRMFICSYYDYNLDILHDMEADEENLPNWFTEYCDFCNKKIDNYRYAVRIPMINGGWKGCYCSWECIMKENKKYHIPSIEFLIKYYRDMMNKIGIQR